MNIPFTKAHGARNDFLLSWRDEVPEGDRAAMARAICHRHTGVGADGWMLVEEEDGSEADGAIQLYNSDGMMPEISDNGTRCAAAFLLSVKPREEIRIRTGAGIKNLRLLGRRGRVF